MGYFLKKQSTENQDVHQFGGRVDYNEGRWAANHQKQIYNSRMEATDELLRIYRIMRSETFHPY